jgi:hypothetical protein
MPRQTRQAAPHAPRRTRRSGGALRRRDENRAAQKTSKIKKDPHFSVASRARCAAVRIFAQRKTVKGEACSPAAL